MCSESDSFLKSVASILLLRSELMMHWSALWRATKRGRKPVNAVEQANRAEFIVRGLTLTLAAGSFGFAVHMIADGEREPRFAGLEYLSIFSKPNGYATGFAVDSRESANRAKDDIDFTSVGSVRKAKTKSSALRYSILQASSEFAVVKTPNAVIRVRRGEEIDALGRVVLIENQNGRWAIITANGSVIGD